MENIENHLKESLTSRSIEVINRIATENPQYKQIVKKISILEGQLIKDLSKEKWKQLDNHRDLNLQLEALIVDLVYQQGFKDGADFRTLLQKLSSE